MGDIRERVEGTASAFARDVDDEAASPGDGGDAPELDGPRGDGAVLPGDVNDVEAALNPDEQHIERSSTTNQIEGRLDQEEGRAGD